MRSMSGWLPVPLIINYSMVVRLALRTAASGICKRCKNTWAMDSTWVSTIINRCLNRMRMGKSELKISRCSPKFLASLSSPPLQWPLSSSTNSLMRQNFCSLASQITEISIRFSLVRQPRRLSTSGQRRKFQLCTNLTAYCSNWNKNRQSMSAPPIVSLSGSVT